MWMTIPFTMRSVQPFVNTRMTESPWKTPRADSMVFHSSVSHNPNAPSVRTPSVQGARCAVPKAAHPRAGCATTRKQLHAIRHQCDRRPRHQRLCLKSVCNYEVLCKLARSPLAGTPTVHAASKLACLCPWHQRSCSIRASMLVPVALDPGKDTHLPPCW